MTYRVSKTDYGMYCILLRVNYPSGDLAFWQQIGKLYTYKKSILKKLNQLNDLQLS